ncbi:hypothetical protein BTA51_13975 [Hahella sp. CCB-MM4]|uniref:hypothetical protein n=1 Tax=Hahella sp. (strain CCB-MM4) TaxID=1926491 RepID=UPI000B9A4CEE|nr:hypothetical protein [Hahella sp. CCB-MM4]OZG72633.1 hypothetical protein BTA51_13975 [Hahella sp. CCB-MM4]
MTTAINKIPAFSKGIVFASALLLSPIICAEDFGTIEGNAVVNEQLNNAVMADEDVTCSSIWTLSCIWPDDCHDVAVSTGFVKNKGCDVYWNKNSPDKSRGCGYTVTQDGSLHAKWYKFDEQGCPGRVFVFEKGVEYEILVR